MSQIYNCSDKCKHYSFMGEDWAYSTQGDVYCKFKEMPVFENDIINCTDEEKTNDTD